MKQYLLAFSLALAGLGCQISPVVNEPLDGGSRYDDCRRAALDYCRDLGQSSEGDTCISRATFECVSAQ